MCALVQPQGDMSKMSNYSATLTEQLWEDFTSQLRRFISARVSNEADVNDILQEVFIKIHRSIDRLEDPSKLHAWVYQITRNVIIDYYRKAEKGVEITSELPDVLVEESSDEEVEAEVATWLRPMMEELPEKYREALQLTDIQGLTQKELAERLNISLSGAKSRVQRAREKLKDVLLECCHVEIDQRGKVVDWESREPDCRFCTVPLTRK
jgi:RNA polymerase sigma-70 factor (ECF subfamily)